MKINRVDLTNTGKELDTVVVIDVLRAFTTTAFAFEAGASQIVIVSGVDEAFGLKSRFPDALLMGENYGHLIEGFNYGNSPSALVGEDLSGKTLIHRTSAGTQGVVKSSAAKTIYVTGLCNALTTANAVKKDAPGSLTLVETGVRDGEWGEEDVACADYIQGLLTDKPVDPQHISQQVRESKAAKQFVKGNEPRFPEDDLDLVLDIDRFDFIMKIEKADDLLILHQYI